MADYTTFNEIAVGDRFPETPLQFDVTESRVRDFLNATGNTDPAYGPESGRAPSMLAAVYLVDLLKARNSPPGGIHAKQSIRFSRALRVGERLSLSGEVVEKYVRRDRPYVVSGFTAADESGAVVACGTITSIWGRGE